MVTFSVLCALFYSGAVITSHSLACYVACGFRLNASPSLS